MHHEIHSYDFEMARRRWYHTDDTVGISEKIVSSLEEYNRRDSDKLKLDELYRTFRRWIAVTDKPVVLIIDEVDRVTNNQVFIDLLGLLRDGYKLRIWHGQSRHEEGERQISEYLDYYGLTTGYMLSFNFNKKKERGVKPVHIGDKLLYEGTV